MLFTELADSFNIDWSCGDNNKFLKKTPAAFFIYTGNKLYSHFCLSADTYNYYRCKINH